MDEKDLRKIVDAVKDNIKSPSINKGSASTYKTEDGRAHV